MSPPIFLIGYRGTGKSTVARLLARELGVEAVDSDEIIQQQAGCTIAEIFDSEGEAAFRAVESDVVAQLCDRDNIVAALGGGAIVSDANRTRIAESGLIVWLQASPQTIAERLAADAATQSLRPSLTGGDVIEEIESVLAERTPYYEDCADLVVATTGRTPSQVASLILELLSAEAPVST